MLISLVNVGLDFTFKVLFEESSEVNLEVFKKTNTSGKSISIKRRSNFNKGGNWVGGTEFSKFHEGFSGGVWGDSLKFGDDNFKSVEDKFGLFLSFEEEGVIDLSLMSLIFFKLFKIDKGLLVDDDLLLKLSSLVGKGSDGLGGFRDLIGGI